MNKIWKPLRTLAIVAGMIILGWYGGWWDCILPGKPVSKTVPKPPPPNLQIAQTELTGWDNAQKTWVIRARKIWQGNEGDVINFERIADGVIFAVKGRRVDFSAGWARFEKYSNRLLIGGGITARFTEGILKTPEAVMNFGTGEMLCRQEVSFRGKDATMKAARITVNFEREELDLAGGVEFSQNGNYLKAGGLLYQLKDEKYRLIEPEGVTLKL